MVLLNAASRARNSSQTKNQCQGGGDKKAGLLTRQIPSSVSIAYSSEYRSRTNIMFMMPHQRNVTAGLGVGRKVTGIRKSAWNTNGTSANICMINESSASALVESARVAANTEVMRLLLINSNSLFLSAGNANSSTQNFTNSSMIVNYWGDIEASADLLVNEVQTLTKIYTAPLYNASVNVVIAANSARRAIGNVIFAQSAYNAAKALSDVDASLISDTVVAEAYLVSKLIEAKNSATTALATASTLNTTIIAASIE